MRYQAASEVVCGEGHARRPALHIVGEVKAAVCARRPTLHIVGEVKAAALPAPGGARAPHPAHGREARDVRPGEGLLDHLVQEGDVVDVQVVQACGRANGTTTTTRRRRGAP
eukprot:1190771-Prorocentrum_minimum.AAC.2